MTNLQNTALTALAFSSGDFSLLETSLEDRLHQPYRKELIPGFDAVVSAARSAGAYGAALSGAGPAVAAFTIAQPERVAQAMKTAYRDRGEGGCQTLVLGIDREGAVLEDLPG